MLDITALTKEDAATCPVRSVLSKVTGKWQILIFLALEDESHRFGELKRTVGDITPRVLTENLKSLERDGFLTRTVHSGPPLAVSYELTEMGHSFIKVIKPVVFWAGDNFQSIDAARKKFSS